MLRAGHVRLRERHVAVARRQLPHLIVQQRPSVAMPQDGCRAPRLTRLLRFLFIRATEGPRSEWPFAIRMGSITEPRDSPNEPQARPPGGFQSAFNMGSPIEPLETLSRVSHANGAKGFQTATLPPLANA